MSHNNPLRRIADPRRPALFRFHPSAFLLLSCLPVAIGCDAVQEDRRVQFSPSGDQVAFQHGSDGIFVADPQTGALRKVFDPDPSILAVSTPLWSDDETRAIFTTSRQQLARDASRAANSAGIHSHSASAQPATASAPAVWEDAPQGRLFLPQAIEYTCWLLERAADGAFSKPLRLFEAHCDHAGYVAGNLAVRWQPRQKRIVFVERDSIAGHAVWSFDLETKQKTKLFPPAGKIPPMYVIADFVPGGDQVVCVATPASWIESQPVRPSPATTTSKPSPPSVAGIWIGAMDGANWWHVPQSAPPEGGNFPQGLSNLVSQRPAFPKDGRLFAFLRDGIIAKDSKPQTVLYRARVADRKVETIFTTRGDVRDLHWSPDGARLGFIVADPIPRLKTIDSEKHVRELFSDRFVRDFAGWNAVGDKLACVVVEKRPEKLQPSPSKPTWAFVLMPDPLARDAVLVVDQHGAERTVASGPRFTFPQWSPRRDQLSMWGTFSPSHQSLIGFAGVGRGDPACIVDVSKGAIRWLAINGDELAQVGHYFSIKHDFVQAREWYGKADKQLPKLEPLREPDPLRGLSGAMARQRTFEFFYGYCLTRVGEPDQAAARLARFDRAYRIEWTAAPVPSPDATGPHQRAGPPPATNQPAPWSSAKSRQEAETFVAVSKALSVAQVFLSLDDPAGAQTWFGRRLPSADANERLGDLLALSQLQLLTNNNREYATLATDQLAPRLFESLEEPAPIATNPTLDDPVAIRFNMAVLSVHALGPLFCESFLKDLPAEFVSQLVPKWEALRGQSHSRVAAFSIDLFLQAAAARLGHEKDRATAAARIAQNPVRSRLMLPDKLEPYFTQIHDSRSFWEGQPL